MQHEPRRRAFKARTLTQAQVKTATTRGTRLGNYLFDGPDFYNCPTLVETMEIHPDNFS